MDATVTTSGTAAAPVRPLRVALLLSALGCVALAVLGAVIAGYDLSESGEELDGLGVMIGGAVVVVGLVLAGGFAVLAWAAGRAPRPIAVTSLVIGGLAVLFAVTTLLGSNGLGLALPVGLLGLAQVVTAIRLLTAS